jgi:hypothetical protein
MKTLKKVIRVFVLTILIILAASGILAIFLPVNRERYVDKEIRVEQVDKKKGEDETIENLKEVKG